MKACLRRYPQHVPGYTFATLAAYAPIYGIVWSRVGPECLLLARRLGDALHLLQIRMPGGKGAAKVNCLLDFASY